jgi:hypothetical protein
MTKYSGGCACGAIRYEAEAAPLLMLNCHCRDCQRASGSAFQAIAAFPKQAVTLTGTPRYYRRLGDSGKAIERGFCPECGSPVGGRLEQVPDVFLLQAGTFDDPALFKPAMDLFTSSAHPWDHMDPDLPKRPRGVQD